MFGIISCTNKDNDKKNEQAVSNSDTMKFVPENQTISADMNSTSALNSESPSLPMTTNPDQGIKSNEVLNAAKLEYKIFKNSNTSGYGYDIYVNGVLKFHQPNIPAIPGNNGFKSEEQARKVAELVLKKMKNNMDFPTIEVKELDSLGIK